ncbi:aminotransferase class I and II [Methylobacterium sp. 4-46]|uniref:pyridoxal phosphate-dependent aminotransferase n=1 Tax=unclassified Methylobacterium TaxID=2615210 RepID=UPI000165CE26|nr:MULTISPECIES: pyridoxal phosphate-dependent aminotransferase [Methylobacterium]ACA19231.1 aminotransferase class I and II [Methylobacterium sp. 4-46]WFT78437.1 pyridoxal phosphate-dependent aminotransferase [Methylobacterium nodulans]
MTEAFLLADYLARWSGEAPNDLAASDSETLPVASLLALADEEDRRRWNALDLGYADPRGAPWLRAAVASRYAGLAPEAVLACAGAQEAATCVLRALLGPQDHAVIVLPLYQPSERVVTALCAATGVPLAETGGSWALRVDRVATALRPNTRVVLTNFPNSPTGATLDGGTLRDLVGLCRARGLWLVNDEVYRETATDEGPPACVEAYERGVSVDGLSKGFGLPGLRVGWVACRDPILMARTLAVKSTLSSCLSATSEVLAHIALRHRARILARTRAIGLRNRARLDDLLARHRGRLAEDGSRNLAFGFPRYLGPEGAERFAVDLARRGRCLVLPSTLWRSPLAPLPADRLRIGLGQARAGAALDALDAHLEEVRA